MSAAPAKQRTRVLLVDDHLLVRKSLSRLLSLQEDLVVCGEAATADEGAEAAFRLKPDLAIVDLTLGAESGLPLISRLLEQVPGLQVLVLSMHDEEVFALPAMEAGARGFVMKQMATNHLFKAIREVLAGRLYFSARLLESHSALGSNGAVPHGLA
ncbi:MAG TPA: response regulator transcription factor [Chthoniobacterales bacterium]